MLRPTVPMADAHSNSAWGMLTPSKRHSPMLPVRNSVAYSVRMVQVLRSTSGGRRRPKH